MTNVERELFAGSRFRVVKTPDLPDAPAKEVIRHPGAVVILPLLPDGDVCLIRNRRVAVGETLIELPAGTREPGEPPLATAGRELTEETGYSAGQISPLCEFFVSPGMLDERMYLFVARDLQPGPQSLEHDERITPLPTPLEEALAMIADGRIRDAKTMVGLLYWSRWGG